MKRRIEFICKKIKHYTELLDHAKTRGEIKMALQMKRSYENALLALEDRC